MPPVRKYPNDTMSSLRYEPVPIPAPFANLRSSFSLNAWARIEDKVRASKPALCQDCGDVGKLEMHEEWRYDDAARVQRLDSFALLCADCHEVRHLSVAVRHGRGAQAFGRLQQLLGLTRPQAFSYLTTALETWTARNRFEWSADLRAIGAPGPHPKAAVMAPLVCMGLEAEHSATYALSVTKHLPLMVTGAQLTKFVPAHQDLH